MSVEIPLQGANPRLSVVRDMLTLRGLDTLGSRLVQEFWATRMMSTDLARAIDRAIAEERETCAGIAETWTRLMIVTRDDIPTLADCTASDSALGDQIAFAIRARAMPSSGHPEP